MLRRGFAIGRLAGIEIRLDPSLAIVFLLIVTSLALGAFPSWHPDWTALTSWAVAAAAGVLFLLSILLHELAHAVVAKAYRLPVHTIVLYLFGGVANIEEEPERPGVEFWMAIVGPLTSIALGFGSLVLAGLLAGPPPANVSSAAYAQSLGPLATVLAWLGPVNLALGIFNMLPGFPLDGGRVLRAALWKGTGSFEKATRWSSRGGVIIGWLLVAIGVAMALGVSFPFLGGGLLGGIWLALIGWFMSRLATWAEQRALLEATLDRVQVGDIMARHLDAIPPDLTLAEFAHRWAGHHDQTSWPVLRDRTLIGIVRAEDLRRVPRDEWDVTSISAIMLPAGDVPVTSPGEPASKALRKLSQTPTEHVAVEDEGRWLGLVRQLDIVRWLRLHAAAR